jgi:hypothetical protein
LQILRQNEYNQSNHQVITGILNQQNFVICEPWHHKVNDLSLQFFSNGKGQIEYKGTTTFTTDSKGHFTGNYIQELPPDLPRELKEFIQLNLKQIEYTLIQSLNKSRFSTGYFGWLGVDVLIYKSENGNFRIHPCVEINCRLTMGAIALSLRKHLAENSTAEFRIMHGKEGAFAQFCEEKEKNAPLITENSKIVRGILPLTSPTPTSVFGVWIEVSERAKG